MQHIPIFYIDIQGFTTHNHATQRTILQRLQTMATEACPKAIKEATGEQVYFPSSTDSDRESYITMKWVGEPTT